MKKQTLVDTAELEEIKQIYLNYVDVMDKDYYLDWEAWRDVKEVFDKLFDLPEPCVKCGLYASHKYCNKGE